MTGVQTCALPILGPEGKRVFVLPLGGDKVLAGKGRIDQDGSEYGFRADTDGYAHMLRLNPNRGEYNLYIYCYVRERLE